MTVCSVRDLFLIKCFCLSVLLDSQIDLVKWREGLVICLQRGGRGWGKLDCYYPAGPWRSRKQSPFPLAPGAGLFWGHQLQNRPGSIHQSCRDWSLLDLNWLHTISMQLPSPFCSGTSGWPLCPVLRAMFWVWMVESWVRCKVRAAGLPGPFSLEEMSTLNLSMGWALQGNTCIYEKRPSLAAEHLWSQPRKLISRRTTASSRERWNIRVCS